MVEILEGLRAVKQSPADGLDLEGYILDCGEDLVLVDTGFTPQDVEIYENELRAMEREGTTRDAYPCDSVGNLAATSRQRCAFWMAGRSWTAR